MPECYEFEECEYNGQPRCYLPDGVDCPHGVGAGANEGGHLMDIDKLIEDLRGLLEQYGEKIPYGELVGAPWPYSKAGDLVWPDPEPYFIEQAATALSTLQAENEKLRETVDKYATAARVIALHLKPFCDESLAYDEMIADAARKASDELEQVKRENNALWTYIEIVDREYRRYMDRGYIDRLDELKRTWRRGQKED